MRKYLAHKTKHVSLEATNQRTCLPRLVAKEWGS